MQVQECAIDPSKLTVVLDESIESRVEQVGSVVEHLMELVRSLPCAQAHLDEVQLALTEALANAVIHGNQGDPRKRVHIWGACAAGEQLVLAITDEGEGFDAASIPDPTLAENVFCDHGRGIFLMNRLMDSAEHRLGGRQVVLRKRVRGTQ
jgi:serine/threonine-protein kinase RsbW